jgi:metallo-beta-lactamase family protein
MKITFHGAAGTVTGSKHLVELEDGRRILLDCGMFQGLGELNDAKNYHFGFAPHLIDVVVLSHAHIDHSGLLPRFVDEGFRGTIYSTPATLDLCRILLEDSARIQESDHYYDLKRKERGENITVHEEPLYTAEDVFPALRKFRTLEYGQAQEILEGVKLTFTDAGHILGSAVVNLAIEEGGRTRSLMFTGDVGRYVNRLLPAPTNPPQAEIIIGESTYGDRDHEPLEEASEMLLQHIVDTCVKKSGKLIIPAFSVGKTQEILYTLNALSNENALPGIPVFLDSPLAIDATSIFGRYAHLFRDEVKEELLKDPDLFNFPGSSFVLSAERSKWLNTYDKPCIIISAAGMMNAGRIKHHLKHSLGSPRNTVLVVGFCSPGTLGRRLLDGADMVWIHGEHIPVKAEIKRMSFYSAHADRSEMLRFMKSQDPSSVQHMFVVHGNDDARKAMKVLYEQEGFRNVMVPEQGEECIV